MACDKYRKALIEAAATSGELPGRLEDHVVRCVKCRAALQRERLLLGAIDQTVRARMNQEPQAGLLAGVRAQIAKAAPPESRWIPIWRATAAALAVAFIAMAGEWAWPPKRHLGAANPTYQTVSAQPRPEFAQPGRNSTERSDLLSRIPQHRTKKSAALPAAHLDPEVLVPPEEAQAFAQFVTRLRRDEVAQAFVSPVAETNEEPLQIPPVEIARLQLKPLAWEKWK